MGVLLGAVCFLLEPGGLLGGGNLFPLGLPLGPLGLSLLLFALSLGLLRGLLCLCLSLPLARPALFLDLVLALLRRYLSLESLALNFGFRALLGHACLLLVLLGNVAYGGSSGGQQVVTVRPGDTVWSIVESHEPEDIDVRQQVDDVIALNHLQEGALVPGQALTLPPP